MAAFSSSYKDIDLPVLSLTDFIMPRVKSFGNKLALADGKRAFTFTEVYDNVEAFAYNMIHKFNVKQGDVIAVFAPNSSYYPIVFHGILRAGAIVSTINPAYTIRELEHQLHDCGAMTVFTVSDLVPMVKEAQKHGDLSQKIKHIIAIDTSLDTTVLEGASRGIRAPPIPRKINPLEDIAVLPYSSGTTGLSKGVMLTHHNIVTNILQILAVEKGMTHDSVLFAVLPFFHIYGMVVLMQSSLYLGCTLPIMPKFDLVEYLKNVEKYKVTIAHIVPPIALALAKSPVVSEYNVSSIKEFFSGAAPLGEELQAELQNRLKSQGVIVKQGYGMTELSPVSHICPSERLKLGSCGVLVPNCLARIVDPITGKDLPVNQDGELWVKGPLVMKGYLNNKKATDETIDKDGWLHTGDIGHVDEDGFYFIVDRLKELIKVKGFQVPPAELESVLLTHPSVADCAVIGIPDVAQGEAVKAFVVLKPNQPSSVNAQVIKDFVASQVVHYKKIRDLEFVPLIPKTASGKILRRVLRDQEKSKSKL